jgi:hypothetical protein
MQLRHKRNYTTPYFSGSATLALNMNRKSKKMYLANLGYIFKNLSVLNIRFEGGAMRAGAQINTTPAPPKYCISLWLRRKTELSI